MIKFIFKPLRFYAGAILLIALLMLVACADEKEIPTPEIFTDMPDGGYEVDLGDTLTITPQIIYDYNSSYQWIIDGVVESTDKVKQFIPDRLYSLNYTFIVSNPSGSDTTFIPVHAIRRLDFDSLKLQPDTFWCGKNGETQFLYKKVTFPVTYDAQVDTWSGFAYSNMTDKTTGTIKNALSAFPGKGSSNSTNYLVYHQANNGNEPPRIVFADHKEYRIRSMDVVNSTYVCNAIKFGTDMVAKFESGDWYLLHINGYRADGTPTKELQFYLADYRSEIKTERYLLETWTTITSEMLAELGRVNQLEFVLDSSDKNVNPLNTLNYFCLDHLKLMD